MGREDDSDKFCTLDLQIAGSYQYYFGHGWELSTIVIETSIHIAFLHEPQHHWATIASCCMFKLDHCPDCLHIIIYCPYIMLDITTIIKYSTCFHPQPWGEVRRWLHSGGPSAACRGWQPPRPSGLYHHPDLPVQMPGTPGWLASQTEGGQRVWWERRVTSLCQPAFTCTSLPSLSWRAV